MKTFRGYAGSVADPITLRNSLCLGVFRLSLSKAEASHDAAVCLGASEMKIIPSQKGNAPALRFMNKAGKRHHRRKAGDVEVAKDLSLP
jgi:hypothetical protein